MDSETFYDDFADRQSTVGINHRHRAILEWLKTFGLSGARSVLEIGCGVGTVTGLILDELRDGGKLVAVDLSSKSIEVARRSLRSYPNLELRHGDVLKMEIEGPFDVVVLPDVIEHIPLESHRLLFSRLRSWVAAEGFIFLHYPNPWYLRWRAKNAPELLQHVDQPIDADLLASNAYANGLYLEFLKTYSIWIKEGDYVAAVLRPSTGATAFHDLAPRSSFMSRIGHIARKLLP